MSPSSRDLEGAPVADTQAATPSAENTEGPDLSGAAASNHQDVLPASPEIAPAGPQSIHDDFQSPAITTHPAWPGATVLDHRELPPSNGLVQRVTLLQPSDFPYAIYVEERLNNVGARYEDRLVHRFEAVANHLLVKLSSHGDVATLAAVVRIFDGTLREHPSAPGLFYVDLPRVDWDGVPRAQKILSQYPDIIEYAEPDAVIRAAATIPDDPRFPDDQWGLNNTGQNRGTVDVDINAPEAWDIRREATDVIVAIVDSGIRHTHEDLPGNLWINPGESGLDGQGQDKATNGLDDDGNGFVDDLRGINAIDDSNDPSDDIPDPVLGLGGHGTAVAGVVGAVGNNGLGMSGVAWKVQLMALKWFNNQGAGALSDAIQCIDYARAHGAHIINASWQQGGLLSGTVSQSMIDALQRLRQDGILFVSSAGNDGDNNDLVAHYPSNYPFDNMVAVAAITRSGTLSRQSNYGERLVDLAAPGDNILSLSSKADNEYTMVSGTSFAAPHVSGMLALLKAQFPSEDYRTLIHRLYAGVSRSDRLIGKVRTGGVANLMKSMSLTSVPEFPEITDFTFNGTTVASEQEVTVTQGSDVAFMVSANGAAPLTFAWRRDGKLINGANTSSLQITDFSAADIAEYQVTISNSAGSATLGMRLLGVIEKPELSEAVNASNRTFLTSGNTLWDGQNVVSRDGISAGASGRVAARQGTMASTQVTGPGKARFFWKVSSERNNDTLDLLVDNVRTDSISGEVDWTRKELTLSEGTHELRWQYVKDASLSKGEDRGYLDQFQFESTAAAAPTILSESRSQAVVEGSAAFLMVLANGAEPLSYQWFKDGAILPDATSNRLDFPSVSANNHGRYSVVVGNEAGTATSGIMLLTVTPQPLPARIAMHPVNKTIQEGGSVSLTASVTGTPPIQYQWRKGNLDLPGQTSLTLTLTDLQVQDSGAYSLRATNPVGSDTSREAQLTVVQLQLAPAITKHPAAVTVNNGDPIELVVEASGLGPFTYVWTRNGVTIPGESEFNFVRPDAVPSDAGEYQVRVISPFGSSLSEAARVHVNVTSQALGQAMDNSEVLWSTGGASPWSMQTSVTWDGVDALQSGVIQDNDFSELTTTVVGPGQISFWWSASSEYGYDFLSFLVDDELIDQISGFWDWEEVIWNIPEGIHTLTWIYFKDEIASDGADAGWLDAFAFASFNTESPVVVRHPQDQSGIVGSEVTIDLEVSGNPPFSYQWFFGGERMDGATGATLTLRDLTSDQQGLYSVVVTNSFGTTTSRAAEVFVFDRAELVDYTLNSPGLNWMDDDAAPWFPQVAVTADGESAMQSGPIGDGGQSSQRTAVSGPGLLYFFWKVSSEEDYDFLDFLIDDELFLYRSGEVDWEDMSILIPPGIHILEWVYTKDEILSDGADAAWLDAVEYIELDAFSYWQQLNFFPGELLDPEISDQDADPDRDGWRNIEEFGFGLDPFSSHNTYRPSARLVQTSIGQVLELTYLRRTDEPNLVYSIALSNDLEKWTMSPASDWEESLIKWDQGLQQVRTRYRIPVGPDSLFARVLIRY